jgi:ATP-dependent DNA helicase RecQ
LSAEPGALEAEVTELKKQAQREAEGSERALVAERLSELRLLYRRNPSAFSSEVLEMLREIAGSVAGGRTEPERPAVLQPPEEVLKDVFGYDSFRPGQREIIDAVLSGQDCVGVMPTGSGKSITYQVPAIALERFALVVSPLIALMKDQVDALSEAGVSATFLNSTLSFDERRERLAAIAAGKHRLVYVAPEGLESRLSACLPQPFELEAPLRERADVGAHRHRHAAGDARHRAAAGHALAQDVSRLVFPQELAAGQLSEGRLAGPHHARGDRQLGGGAPR